MSLWTILLEYFKQVGQQFCHPLTATAQILGFIPVGLAFFIFRSDRRMTIIGLKALSDFLSAVHFLLLGQITGCAVNAVNVFRGLCFAQRGHRKWASGLWMPVAFCFFTVISSLFSWAGPISLLPTAGSCLAVVGYWSAEPRRLRYFNLAGISLWTVYGLCTLSVPTVVGNAISIGSILCTELRHHRNGRQHRKEQPV